VRAAKSACFVSSAIGEWKAFRLFLINLQWARIMHWADGFIAVDWGTTNRRAYAIGADGQCTAESADDRGILSVPAGGFEAALAEIRVRLGDRPMLLAGMIGSNRGWIEVPYVRCPAGLEELARGIVRSPDGSAVLVPGVAYENGRVDIMRGEEVQILGAAADGEIPQDCLVCHPGTHNKWIRLEAGRIVSFRTVMTGELFNLLKAKSILSDLLNGQVEVGAAFSDGVREGLAGAGVTAELFEIRARVLLGRTPAKDGASFISGLLIGEDVRIGLAAHPGTRVIVIGRADLAALYASALKEAGVESEQASGERAFIAGAKQIVELIK
jgi:2-dehydro-3-deoxygalactonokinase